MVISYWPLLVILIVLVPFLSSGACNERNHTAIIVSGSLGAGNFTWKGDKIHHDHFSRMFGDADPPTPIQTTLEFVVKVLANYGDVDIFIYLKIKEKDTNTSMVTCDDMRDLFLHHSVFRNNSNNHVFCFQEVEKNLAEPFIGKIDGYKTFYPHMHNWSPEPMLQQSHGMYMGNHFSKQYSLLTGKNYTYKVRVRPDIAFVKPIPILEKMPFKANRCNGTVLFGNPLIGGFRGGGTIEDIFNIGYASDMDVYFDKYLDITTSQFIFSPFKNHDWWNSESYYIGLLQKRYNKCAIRYDDIWVGIVRGREI